MLLVSQLLALPRCIFFEQFRSPFAHDRLRCILTSSKPKTARKSRIVTVDGSERDKGIFGIELLDVLQRLPSRISFRKLGQRPSQEIEYRGLLVELVNIGVMPLVARSVKVRHVRDENGFAREKRTHSHVRCLFRN